jgi:hypothetical protein
VKHQYLIWISRRRAAPLRPPDGGFSIMYKMV